MASSKAIDSRSLNNFSLTHTPGAVSDPRARQRDVESPVSDKLSDETEAGGIPGDVSVAGDRGAEHGTQPGHGGGGDGGRGRRG